MSFFGTPRSRMAFYLPYKPFRVVCFIKLLEMLVDLIGNLEKVPKDFIVLILDTILINYNFSKYNIH